LHRNFWLSVSLFARFSEKAATKANRIDKIVIVAATARCPTPNRSAFATAARLAPLWQRQRQGPTIRTKPMGESPAMRRCESGLDGIAQIPFRSAFSSSPIKTGVKQPGHSKDAPEKVL
jgi:hypothetical protein